MTSALFTDRYELTMLGSALRDGTADRRCTFEVFARRLPDGRRYGVVAGTPRLLEAIADFTFDDETLGFLRSAGVVDEASAEYLATYRFGGDIDGYPEGELYFPHSPVLTVSGTFAESVILETLVLSILNHDSAVAAAAARMVAAAGGRPLIEMGSRRTHEHSAVAAARAAYLAGFASTSNLAASRRYGVPTAGTAAHAFVLLHDDERRAFQSQVDSLGTSTTLLVDTFDIRRGIEAAIDIAGTGLGAIRIDSGELLSTARHAREQLDRLGATGTRIVVSGDLDEFAIASLAAAPVDAYGAGTAVVTGSGAPTAGFVYKLVEVDGRPVSKRSEHKESHGGRKTVLRAHKASGTALEEIVVSGVAPTPGAGERLVQRSFLRDGVVTAGLPTLDESREHLRSAIVSLPWDGLKLSGGEPAIGTRVRGA
jgi:nicotinate phosphoribosyltransferase